MVWPAAVAQVIDQVRGNHRLQLGLALILGILWFYGILSLNDRMTVRVSEIRAEQFQLARLSADAGRTQWPERAETAKAMQIAEEATLWHESTPGLARAAFQDWLNETLFEAGIDKANLKIGSQEPAVSQARPDAAGPAAKNGLWKVTAELSLPFLQGKTYALLAALAEHREKVAVESLTLQTTPSPQVRMSLTAWFRKQAPTKP